MSQMSCGPLAASKSECFGPLSSSAYTSKFTTIAISNITAGIGYYTGFTNSSWSDVADTVLGCDYIDSLDEIIARDVVKFLAGPDVRELCDFKDTFNAAVLSSYCGHSFLVEMMDTHWEVQSNLWQISHDEEIEDEEKEQQRTQKL